MKNLIKIIIAVACISSSLSFIEAAQRRAGTTATRGIFSRGGTTRLDRTFTTKGFKSITPVTCPSSVQTFGTKTGGFGTQAREFAGKHTGKLFAVGTAGATYAVGKSLSERGKQQSKMRSDLKEFHDALWSYDDSQQANQNLDAIILRLEENGGINQKNESDNTPIMMVIAAAKLKPEERKKILKALIARGAMPGEKELASALSLPSYFHVKDFSWARSVVINPNLTALKVLLPHYDQQTVTALINEAQSRIDDLILDFESKKSSTDYKIEHWHEQRDLWIKKRADALQSPAFAKLRKENREEVLAYYEKNIDAYKESLQEEQFKILQKEGTLKAKVEPFKQLVDIAQKALNKGRLSGTSSYKEEDWTVAQ